jgi:Tfp pilus assembly PilM family ATPase/Tfp pilus assembly protein PilN
MKIPVAIEINEEFLKIVTPKPVAKQAQSCGAIAKQISQLDDKQISELLAKTLQQLKVNPSGLVLCIPRNQVTVRMLNLPSQDRNELNQMLDLRIVQIVPYKKEEIVYDYVFCGTDEIGYTKLMLVIIHRDIIKRQLKIIEMAGFFADEITLSSFAVHQRLLSCQKSDISAQDLYLVLDVDSSYTDFIVFNRENLLFTRGIAMRVDNDGLDPGAINKLWGEVRQSLAIFHNEVANKNPLKIFLGGGNIVLELEKIIGRDFDIPAKVIAAPSLEYKNISFTALSELAQVVRKKRISFMPPELQVRKNLKDKMREMAITGSLVAYLLMALLLFFGGKLGIQQAYLNSLKDYNRTLETDTGKLQRDYKHIKFVKDFIGQRESLLGFFTRIQKIIPQDIAMDSISVQDDNSVTLKGHSIQTSEVFDFVKTLEDSKCFKNVVVKSTRTRKESNTNKEITDFEIDSTGFTL